MIGTVLKAFVVIAVVVAITTVVGVFIMAGVAGTHEVVPIPVPSYSYVANHVLEPDYLDCYRAPLEFTTYINIERVIEHAPHKGEKEVYRDEKEVVYEGHAVGLQYFRSYILDRGTVPATLSIVTAVKIEEKKGRHFWRLIRPIHKRLAPFMLDRMAQSAPD
jgi:hypothetical protein